MADTLTCQLWRDWRRQQEAAWKNIEAAAAAEFPPGTRVRWLHSPGFGARADVYREGVVRDSYGVGLNVQMKPGGPVHRVNAYLADVVAPADGARGSDSQGGPSE